jgi:hypothetical protein
MPVSGERRGSDRISLTERGAATLQTETSNRGGEKLKTPQSIENAIIRQRGDELIVTTKV